MPGIENCCIDIISSKKEVRFPNGAVLNYRTGVKSRAITTSQAGTVAVKESRITCKRVLLQAPPTSTWLNPGESLTLTTKIDTPTCDGKYLIAPHPKAKGSTQDWISTGTHEIKDGSVTITNDSAIIQKVSAKDNVAQSFAMIDPDLIQEPVTTSAIKKAEKESDLIKIDPSALLPPEIRQQFSDTCKEFG